MYRQAIHIGSLSIGLLIAALIISGAHLAHFVRSDIVGGHFAHSDIVGCSGISFTGDTWLAAQHIAKTTLETCLRKNKYTFFCIFFNFV